ncbi:hypothetical protein A9Q84_11770 [Halobacteriovorax marinus]|uniref:Type II secretion system protein J n=1 Tax=Halobacteriovorax marinus TaxID=97084 RepID=A0A1Y5F7V8_9BACT|nr:hypothetical protein A9Q84_11770 [Halobacteriovorax marinus]
MINLKRKPHILTTNSGFTLIEVLVAITILSMLMATMYSIVSDSTETKDRVISEDREALQIVTALERLELDISQIYSPLYFSAPFSKDKQSDSDFENNSADSLDNQDDSDGEQIQDPRMVFVPSERFPFISVSGDITPAILNENKNELIFLSTSNRRILEDSKQSRFSWIKYNIRSSRGEKTERDGGYELTRATQSKNIYRKDFNWDKVKEHILLTHIKSFQFQFWNAETKKFVDTLTEIGNDQFTPRLIKVKMVWINTDNNEIEIERTYRPLFPFFDTVKDEKEKKLKSKTDGDSGASGEK